MFFILQNTIPQGIYGVKTDNRPFYLYCLD
ncbi:hypothetical protein FHU31_001634 [Mycolicibacterium fluoranthenivorans]|uniref:Uncharacterized protein n=1 Tax=Mycolicibacterium fluoranthenivorans TaxID=258505 RepID=A0A7X5ZC58_9MYCO|nr:hypothetical protein [Mycolicibacterium fluoranthenivorans]